MNIERLKEKAAQLIDDNAEKNKMFEGIDDIRHSRWTPPKKWEGVDWIEPVTKPDPAEALKAAIQILSTVEPKIHFHPLRPGQNNKERAEKINQALHWHLEQAGRRSRANIVRDLVASALTYDEINLQVVYMPYQRRLAKRIQSETKWSKGSKFTLVVHNPKNVFVERSAYGYHSVLLRQVLSVSEFQSYWGKLAEKVKLDEETEYVTLYDYTDEDNRVIWVFEGENIAPDGSESSVLVNEKHGIPFMPWVVRAGGTAIDSDPQYERDPMLANIWRTDGYKWINILASMKMTSAIAHWAFPRTQSTTNSGESPEINYDSMAGNVALKPGETFNVNQPPPIDGNLLNLAAEMDATISGSTIPKVLQDANFPSGAAFATVNAVYQAASAKLDPAKRLAEYALSDALTQMLQWLIYEKDPLQAYSKNYKGSDYGTQILIPHDEIDPENIYIDVELTAHAPVDGVAKVNQAQMMVNQLNYPLAKAYEDLDIPNYEDLEKMRAFEQLKEAMLGADLKRISMQPDLEMQKQQMADQQAAQQPPPQQMSDPVTQMQNLAMMKAAGQLSPDQQMGAMGGMTQATQAQVGFDPNQGGTPPAMAAPGATREAMNGQMVG